MKIRKLIVNYDQNKQYNNKIIADVFQNFIYKAYV